MSVTTRDEDRLESLLTYGVLGGDGPDLDADAALAARVCRTSAAGVGFLGASALHLYARFGHSRIVIPRETSLAREAIEAGRPVVIPDVAAVLGPDHPLITGPEPIAAFAAVPLIGRDGLPLGAVAAHHHKARAFSAASIRALEQVADGVMAKLELYRRDVWEGRSACPTELADPVRLREALERGELVPFLQPMVDLGTGRPVVVESLVRWVHPELGLVAPGEFLPAVEASGLMLPVGRHVRGAALDALVRLRAIGGHASDLRLSVNISPVELAKPGFAAEVLDDLAQRGLPESCLVAEVTETTSFVDQDSAAHQLQVLHEAGVAIALDDYGAGHSSLLRVLALPLRVLKLDRELVTRLPEDSRLGAAVASTISLAAELGLAVVAEGVETVLQASTVQAMGCELGQGWYFGRPTSVDETVRALTADAARDVRVEPQTDARGPEPEAAYLVDVDRVISAWSPGAELLTGYRADDVLGHSCAQGLLAHVDDRGRSLCNDGCPLVGTMHDGAPRSIRAWLHHRDGHLVPVQIEAQAVRDPDGAVVGALETFRDDSLPPSRSADPPH